LALASYLTKQKFRQFQLQKGFSVAGRQQTVTSVAVDHSPADSTKKASTRDHAPSVGSGAGHNGGAHEDSTVLQSQLRVSPSRWFAGFWNHFLTIADSTAIFSSGSEINFHTKVRFTEDAHVGPLRELSYDMLTSLIFSGPLFFGLGMRIGLVPIYQPENGCTGCTLLPEDVPIAFSCVFFLAVMLIILLCRTKGISDPFGYRDDANHLSQITTLAWVGYILAAVDPGNLMKEQKIDWFIMESLAAFLAHNYRCVYQMYRVARLHRLGEQQIRLIDLLQDQRAAIMFEKYLMGELASENLLFWREGVKYKSNFDRNKDFDYSQQVAKMLFRTFVSRHAQLPM
jgi:hypothetical protein